MNIGAIRSALVVAYEALDLGIPTNFENTPFDPPQELPWAVFYFRPNMPQVATYGKKGQAYDEITGFVQIDINIPLGTGDGEAIRLTEILRDAFWIGRWLEFDGQAVRITSCGKSYGRKSEGWWLTPITIYWAAHLIR